MHRLTWLSFVIVAACGVLTGEDESSDSSSGRGGGDAVALGEVSGALVIEGEGGGADSAAAIPLHE